MCCRCMSAVARSAVRVGPVMELDWLLLSAAFCLSVLPLLLTYDHNCSIVIVTRWLFVDERTK